MSLRSLFQRSQLRRTGSRAKCRQAFYRACLETLEARQLLSFTPAVSYAVGASPQSVVTADFNNDGKLDLAVANYDAGTVSVLLGDGGGGFGAARVSAAGSGPISLAIADFNNDGRLDLAVITQTPLGNIWNSGVGTLLGNGDGTFQAPILRAAAIAMAAGDFNADGKIDLVVGWDDFDSGGFVQVLLGNGGRGFTAAQAETSPIQFSTFAGMAVGDLNGDGTLDAVITNGPGSNIVVPFFGNGDGTFPLYNDEPELVTGPEPDARAVAIGDFTGDGIPDLITAGQRVDVFSGHGDGGFDDPISCSANGSIHTGVAVADFNGDGKLDAVTSDADTGTFSLMLGNGAGALLYSGTFAVGSSPSAIVVGDFNRDGLPDVAVANAGSNTVSVRLNDQSWPAVQVGDANGDGKVDAFDLNIVAAHWQQNTQGGVSAGDFTSSNGTPDGKVDAFDLNVIAAHWQEEVTPLAVTAVASSILPAETSLNTTSTFAYIGESVVAASLPAHRQTSDTPASSLVEKRPTVTFRTWTGAGKPLRALPPIKRPDPASNQQKHGPSQRKVPQKAIAASFNDLGALAEVNRLLQLLYSRHSHR